MKKLVFISEGFAHVKFSTCYPEYQELSRLFKELETKKKLLESLTGSPSAKTEAFKIKEEIQSIMKTQIPSSLEIDSVQLFSDKPGKELSWLSGKDLEAIENAHREALKEYEGHEESFRTLFYG